MKKLNLIPVALAALAACGTAAAQSSVTLYGQVAAGVEYRSHQGAGAGGNQWLVNNNEFYVSNFGLRGSEDLGDGMKAVFRLESGFNTDTGTNTTATKFWNRQAFVGIDGGSMGTVTIGRQFSAFVDRAVRTIDPYNVGGNGLQTTPIALYGINRYAPANANYVANDNRADDSVKYRLVVPSVGVDAGVSYGFDDGEGRHYSFDLNQTNGKDYNIGGGYIQYKAPTQLANGHVPTAKTWMFGGNLTFGAVKLYAAYLDNKLESASSALFKPQEDKVVILAARWSLAPNMDLSGAVYSDKGTGVAASAALPGGRDGKKNTFITAIDYYLSKRTLINVAYFATKLSDGYMYDATTATALSGGATHATGTSGVAFPALGAAAFSPFSTFSGFMVGIRHAF